MNDMKIVMRNERFFAQLSYCISFIFVISILAAGYHANGSFVSATLLLVAIVMQFSFKLAPLTQELIGRSLEPFNAYSKRAPRVVPGNQLRHHRVLKRL